jgi:hypothetical protein
MFCQQRPRHMRVSLGWATLVPSSHFPGLLPSRIASILGVPAELQDSRNPGKIEPKCLSLPIS